MVIINDPFPDICGTGVFSKASQIVRFTFGAWQSVHEGIFLLFRNSKIIEESIAVFESFSTRT
jgi:hypothetical protein